MSHSIIARYVHPWRFRREQEELRRVALLRERCGDECRRCRRPMRFDLPSGHDLGPKIEPIPSDSADALDRLCLTHLRCNAQGGDNTEEVTQRVRRKSEAELFAKPRKRARAAR